MIRASIRRTRAGEAIWDRTELLVGSRREGLTLIEVLVALAIALLMMAAVFTVFANVTGSITRRRATIEMSGVVRHVRETLSRDLENATCPAIPWQRPESNHGYLEIIEGPQNDYYPSIWLFDSVDDDDGNPDGFTEIDGQTPGIDLALSSLPGSNLRGPNFPTDEEGRGAPLGLPAVNEQLSADFPTDGRGLGDGDDILMLSVRNEKQPFVGCIPVRSGSTSPSGNAGFINWENEEIESPLAEVIWFAFENPPERDDAQTFAFGEPGFRTIHRRTLLIAPWLNYRIEVGGEITGPGVVRVLPTNIDRDNLADQAQAIAALIAFQERYDLSVRLEWDPLLGDDGRWLLKANSLADLTKRENRYEHHGLVPGPINIATQERHYPFAVVSSGSYQSSGNPVFVADPETTSPPTSANFVSVEISVGGPETIVGYEPASGDLRAQIIDNDRRYTYRPFVYIDEQSDIPATARAVLNEQGNVVHVTRGLVPLSGERQGEDVMVTSALGFDLRVYDPGAPLYAYYPDRDGDDNPDTDERADYLVAPGDPAWPSAFDQDRQNDDFIGTLAATDDDEPFAFERLGAYVDLGYGRTFIVFDDRFSGYSASDIGKLFNQFVPRLLYNPQGLVLPFPPAYDSRLSPRTPSFFRDGPLQLVTNQVLAPDQVILSPSYSVYDTWSWSYENNGINEDRDLNATGAPMIDEGTNGFDDRDPSLARDPFLVDDADDIASRGPDDDSERETRPPYDVPLRGLEVTLRVYEPDSLQVLETKVRESFVPE